MQHTRRSFLSASLASGAAIGFMTRMNPALGDDPIEVEPAAQPLRILMLGGTGFLGPHTVEYAMKRGHQVTLFNRGRTNPTLFESLEKLIGDRDPQKGSGLTALEGRSWDAVIDTSGYVPRHVKASAELLADAVQHYLFVSTISVYANPSAKDIDETAPLEQMDDPTNEEVRKHYGGLKALCEQAAERAMPGRVCNVRPGLIVGPRDFSDRFTYWPVRIARGGEVMAPGSPEDPVQYIDARDLGRWMVHCLEQQASGVYNATGPAAPTNIAELLYGCKAVIGGDAQFTWVNSQFLAMHEVEPWSHMTVWVPPDGNYGGLGCVNIDRALAAGLQFRPLADTVADTLAWFRTLPQERQAKMNAGLDADKEREVLAAWHEREQVAGG